VALAGLLALAPTAAIVRHQLGPNVRYDGGLEEGSNAATGPAVCYDGRPEEGSTASSISGHR
jgi:hypothetical protein